MDASNCRSKKLWSYDQEIAVVNANPSHEHGLMDTETKQLNQPSATALLMKQPLKILQISGTALVLDEIINHVQSLQRQVEFLSMRLAAVNPRIDFGNLDNCFFPPESGSVATDTGIVSVEPLPWPEVEFNLLRWQQQGQQVDAVSQSLWEGGNNPIFVSPESGHQSACSDNLVPFSFAFSSSSALKFIEDGTMKQNWSGELVASLGYSVHIPEILLVAQLLLRLRELAIKRYCLFVRIILGPEHALWYHNEIFNRAVVTARKDRGCVRYDVCSAANATAFPNKSSQWQSRRAFTSGRGKMLPLSFLFLLFSSLSVQSPLAASRTIQLPAGCDRPPSFSVTDYGASGGGKRYDTRAIQAAVDACSDAGGGRVIFPAGSYLTATIFLRSGVVLEVEKGARILGGPRQQDYPRESRRWYVILAEGARDVGITGPGEINGQGWKFVERADPRKNVMVSWNRTGDCRGDECRPRLVGFVGSSNVRVWNITLAQPAYWWCVLYHCYIPLLSTYCLHPTPFQIIG
ncbi:hypothetical protein ACLOJK_020316 [Asimina triloba]